jgi:hypothetical protein
MSSGDAPSVEPVIAAVERTACAAWSPAPRQAVPERVAIVAMGRSCATYINVCARAGDRRLIADETWAIVATAGVIQHDVLFLMDDIPGLLEPTVGVDACMTGMWGWLKDHPGPILTSKTYEDYPGTVEFPLQDVVNAVGFAYFSSSVAYAIGYAIHIGVKQIQLYGCDFTYPNHHAAEAGRACVEFLIAIAMSRGIGVVIAEDSTLLDMLEPERRLYGYVERPDLVEPGEA